MEQHEKKPALCVVVKLIALVVYVCCIYVVFIYVLYHFGWMNGFLGVCHTGLFWFGFLVFVIQGFWIGFFGRLSYRVILVWDLVIMVNRDRHGLGIFVENGLYYWSTYKTDTLLGYTHNTNGGGRLYVYRLCCRWFGVLKCFCCGRRNIVFRRTHRWSWGIGCCWGR